MISSYFRRERASSTAFTGLALPTSPSTWAPNFCSCSIPNSTLPRMVIVTFFRTARALSHRHVGYSAGQRLHRALAVGVGSGRDEQSELARAFGHPISNGLKKIVTSEGLIRDDEDSGHCGFTSKFGQEQNLRPGTAICHWVSVGLATGETSGITRSA